MTTISIQEEVVLSKTTFRTVEELKKYINNYSFYSYKKDSSPIWVLQSLWIVKKYKWHKEDISWNIDNILYS